MKAKVILVLLIAMSFNAVSQNGTFTVHLTTNGSIIREYKANSYIVYNSDGVTSTVNYVDLTSLVMVSAQLPLVDIADFEIYNDSVFFCGTAYNVPIAGLFDINGVFFGGGSIEYIPLTNTMVCNHPFIPPVLSYDAVLSLLKIDVMPVDGGSPHLLMVGDASCTHDPDSVNRCLVDLYYNGTAWTMAVAQAHDGLMYYDDLAVTDSNVAVIGHKHNGEGEYLTIYPRVTNPITLPTIFQAAGASSPSFQYVIYYYNDVPVYYPATDEGFLVEHIAGNVFATVFHGQSYPNYNVTVLSFFNGPSVLSRYVVTDYSTKYAELRYNSKKKKSLFLLPGVNSTCPKSYIEFRIGDKYQILGASKHTDLTVYNPGLTSLDASPRSYSAKIGQAILSGDSDGMLHLWRHDIPTQNLCSTSIDLSPVPIDAHNGPISKDYECSFANPTASVYFPSIEVIPIENECQKK